MAVVPSDLMAPTGELEGAIFPGLDQAAIDARLQAYIDEGEGKAAALDVADRDEATRAWAYYRAFRARAIQLASIPMSVTIPNEISTTRNDGQRGFFEKAADSWLDVFSQLFVVEEESGDQFPATGATVNQYRWPGETYGS